MATHPIRFGIQTGQQSVEWAQMLDLWQKADAWGYDSLWNFDHFYPIFVDPEGPCFEGWTTLSALAQATTRARIGHLVNGNTYRHPCVTAKMAATLDHISGGRLNLGIGAGWFELEHRELRHRLQDRPAAASQALDEALPDHPRHVHAGEDDGARQALHGDRRDGLPKPRAAAASADHDRRHRREGAAQHRRQVRRHVERERRAPSACRQLIDIIHRHGDDGRPRHRPDREDRHDAALLQGRDAEREEFMCNLMAPTCARRRPRRRASRS